MSKAAEEFESRGSHGENSLDDSSVKILWEAFRAIEYELVHANDLCSTCSGFVFQEHLLLKPRSSDNSNFTLNFAEVFNRSRFCWFCHFLCRIVARASLQKHFTRYLKENLPLEFYFSPWERDLLLSVNTTDPTVSYVICIDPRHDDTDIEASVGFAKGHMTCHSLVTPPSIRFRKVLPDTVERKTPLLNEITRWLSVCETRHPKCSQRASAFPTRPDGFRVIDVKSRTLCQPAVACIYLALSYVWGKEPFSRTCESNDGPVLLSDLIKQINSDLRLSRCLPQTIEDAITMTENLGQQYLWVDLICIDQFDPPQIRNAIRTWITYTLLHI